MAVAAMATSMFAADVAAQLKLGTNLYADKAVFTKPTSAGWDDNNTFMKMSVAGDQAGAEIHLSKEDVSLYGLSLWFKPIDAIKVTVGNNTSSTFVKGTFAWWAPTAKLENVTGIKVNGTIGDLGPEALYAAESKPEEPKALSFLDFNKTGYDVVGNFWVQGTYNLGSAGAVQAYVTKGAVLNAYGVGGWGHTAGLAIGLAYDHMPWQQTGFYADALVNFNESGDSLEFDEVVGQLGGQFCKDGLALRLVNCFAYDSKFAYGFVAKASYAINAYTPYVQLLGNSILDKSLGAEVGVDFNVGSCAINAAFKTTIDFTGASAFEFAIPVSFTVAF